MRLRIRSGVVLALVVGAQTMPAQTVERPASPDTLREGKPLFTGHDAKIAAAFAATTILLFPADRRFAQKLQNPNTQANKFFRDASNGVEFIATPGAYYIGALLYGAGRLTKVQRMSDLGWHGTEAVVLGEATTTVLKGLLGRARPFVSNATDPDNFAFGGGFAHESRRSFPSGHTTTAFAAASAVTAETSTWWPESTPFIGTAMYGGATLVGLSRMYHNKHWASDVAIGALIGTFSGLKVVQYAHSHPTNRFDRVMLSAHVVPTPDGLMIAWIR